MDAGRLDLLHDAGNPHLLTVRYGIDVDLDPVFEEKVEQNQIVRDLLEYPPDVLFDLFLVDCNPHSLSAEHVARTHENGVANHFGNLDRFCNRMRHAVGWERYLQLLQDLRELPTVLSKVQHFEGRAEDPDPFPIKFSRQFERSLAAELYDHTLGFFVVDDVLHPLAKYRLEVQLVGNVKVG